MARTFQVKDIRGNLIQAAFLGCNGEVIQEIHSCADRALESVSAIAAKNLRLIMVLVTLFSLRCASETRGVAGT